VNFRWDNRPTQISLKTQKRAENNYDFESLAAVTGRCRARSTFKILGVFSVTLRLQRDLRSEFA
jgi:hypothetical protein